MNKDEEEISYATNKKNIQKTKIVFIGDQYVGKTSIINRFIKNTFDNSHNPTIGIDFVSKNITLNGKMMRLQLWDTAGQERFRSLIPSYLRDSQAAFIIFDLTNEESFNNINKWVDFIKESRGQDVLIFVIGNKSDLEDSRAVTQEMIVEKFKELDLKYWEVSAKSGENIQVMFQEACAVLLELPCETHLTPLEVHQSKVITGSSDVAHQKQWKVKPVGKQTKTGGQKLSKQNIEKDSRRVTQSNCC